ncbi:MAG: glycosyltransferase family 2 protein [Pirellula sp.]
MLPTFSVMIPTYEDRTRFLTALESVLCQDPGKDTMQIAVVDDASKSVNVAEIIDNDSRFRDRVEVYRSTQNRGLAGNWNHAISLARGRFVHILHQDDYVLPGFYAAMERGLTKSDNIGMAYCRSRIVDGNDDTVKTCSRERWFAGVLNSSWLARLSIRQRIQTPSVVVRCEVYQEIGTYRSDLCFALDWEMWVRIATKYQVWYEPRPLACYRRHEANETSRLNADAKTWADLERTVEIIASHNAPSVRFKLARRSFDWHARSAIRCCKRLLRVGKLNEASLVFQAACRLNDRSSGNFRTNAKLRGLEHSMIQFAKSQAA